MRLRTADGSASRTPSTSVRLRAGVDGRASAWPTTDGALQRRRALRRLIVSDAPIEDLHPELLLIARTLIFRPEPERGYRLLYGNAAAAAPIYDLGRITTRAQWMNAGFAALGPVEMNDGYVDPAPWTERHPEILWAALALAVVVVVWMAWRAIAEGRAR